MLLTYLLKLVLTLVLLLVVVPAFTGGAVRVRRGGLFRGILTLLVVGFLNFCLWAGFAIFTAGGAVVLNYLTFGLVGIAINALALVLTSGVMPDVLHVERYSSAFWAALVMTIGSCLINVLIG